MHSEVLYMFGVVKISTAAYVYMCVDIKRNRRETLPLYQMLAVGALQKQRI